MKALRRTIFRTVSVEFRMLILLSALGLGACKPTQPTPSSIAVVNGHVVESPSDSPGTYQLDLYDGDEWIGRGSANLIGPNTVLTNKHVIYSNPSIPRQRIRYKVVDYRGDVVTEFNLKDQAVKLRIPREDAKSTDISQDLAAVVLPDPIPSQKRTHGLARLSTDAATSGRDLRFVGSGLADLRHMRPEMGSPDENTSHGVLRYGDAQNWSSQDGTLRTRGLPIPHRDALNSTMGPGDSGGGAYIKNQRGEFELRGVNVAVDKPSQSTDTVESYYVDLAKHGRFFDTIEQDGALINGRNVDYSPSGAPRIPPKSKSMPRLPSQESSSQQTKGMPRLPPKASPAEPSKGMPRLPPKNMLH